jgi:hypothetical protein
MLKNSMECEFLLTVALKKMSESGVNSTAQDLKDAADKETLFIARERCEFINHCVLANVAITTTTIITVYSLSRREESCKHKLSGCLLACLSVRTSLIGRRKMQKQMELFYIELDQRVIGGGEPESTVSFN